MIVECLLCGHSWATQLATGGHCPECGGDDVVTRDEAEENRRINQRDDYHEDLNCGR